MNESGLYLDICLSELLQETSEGRKDGGRNASLISNYLGFDGLGSCSMDVAGKAYGLTKERVRQINDKSIEEMKALLASKPDIAAFMNAVLDFAASAAPISFARIEEKLKNANFIAEQFKFNGVMSYISFACDDVPFTRERVGDTEFIIPKMVAITKTPDVRERIIEALKEHKLIDTKGNLLDPFNYKHPAIAELLNSPEDEANEGSKKKKAQLFDFSKVVINNAVKTIIHNGAVTFEYVVKLTQESHAYFSHETLRDFTLDLCSSKKGFDDLGWHNGEHWFWFKDAGRNRYYTNARKAIAVAGRLSVDTLTSEMTLKVRDFDFNLPKEVVKNLLVGRDEFFVEGDYFVCKNEFDLAEILTEQELAMVEIMREHEMLNQRNFSNLSSERGVKPYSFSIILNYQPLFMRLGRGEYMLIGSQ